MHGEKGDIYACTWHIDESPSFNTAYYVVPPKKGIRQLFVTSTYRTRVKLYHVILKWNLMKVIILLHKGMLQKVF